MTDAELLDFTHEFRKVRGYSPHRVHLNRSEWVSLMVSMPRVTFSGVTMFDGARIITLWNADVCAAVRAWDLMPYGSEP